MPLHGLPSALPGSATREPSREPGDAVRARELYAAWKSIFENARPAQPGAARSPAAEASTLREPGAAHSLQGDHIDDAGPKIILALRPARLNANSEVLAGAGAIRTRASAAAPKIVNAPAAMPHAMADESRLEPANVAVRIHYVRSAQAPPAAEAQPEAVTIVLSGEDVTIVVRDTGLTDSEALRTAFRTARELTGRSTSLQQLTLNGRVLYQQADRADLAPSGGVLFSC